MSAEKADFAETVVEIHALVGDILRDKLAPGELRAVHEWTDKLIEHVTDSDEDADTVDSIAEVLDSLIAFDALVPLVGPLLERFDGLAWSTLLQWLGCVLKPNPERKARKASERLQRRQRRRKRRRERRGSGSGWPGLGSG